jgi:hypothetical protein
MKALPRVQSENVHIQRMLLAEKVGKPRGRITYNSERVCDRGNGVGGGTFVVAKPRASLWVFTNSMLNSTLNGYISVRFCPSRSLPKRATFSSQHMLNGAINWLPSRASVRGIARRCAARNVYGNRKGEASPYIGARAWKDASPAKSVGHPRIAGCAMAPSACPRNCSPKLQLEPSSPVPKSPPVEFCVPPVGPHSSPA